MGFQSLLINYNKIDPSENLFFYDVMTTPSNGTGHLAS